MPTTCPQRSSPLSAPLTADGHVCSQCRWLAKGSPQALGFDALNEAQRLLTQPISIGSPAPKLDKTFSWLRVTGLLVIIFSSSYCYSKFN